MNRAAAVYDHGVVTAAQQGNRKMALLSIEGISARLAESPRLIAAALASARGVHPRSLRVSLDALALSFSYDARRTSPLQVVAELDLALASLGLRVALLEALSPWPSLRPGRS